MAYQALELGTTADDGTGDSLRIGGDKINDNFVEFYTALGTGTAISSGISASATIVTLVAPIITEIDSGSTITLDATTDIILDADGGDIFFKDAGTTFGSATNTSGNLIIKSGTTTAATFAGANVTLAGTLGVGAITTTGAFKGADGYTIGNASVAAVMTLASTGIVTFVDDIILKDAATIGVTSSTSAISIASTGIVTFVDDIVLKDVATIGVTSSTSAITIASTGIVTFVDDILIKDVGTIGSATTPAAMTIAANGVVTFSAIPSLPADSIDSAEYIDGSIDRAHLAADIIDATKITDNAIDSEHYTDGSIDNAHIADDAIDSEHYAAGSIDTAHIADNQITLAKMAGGTDGNIISYDASGDPVAIATGNDGQVLTSTGAGSPPAFEAAAGGGYTLVESVDITSGTNITTFSHTVEAGYDYLINCRAVEFAADGTANDPPMIQLATTGPSFITSGYINQSQSNSATSVVTANNVVTDGMMWPWNLLHGGATSGEFMLITWELFNPGANESTHCITWQGGINHDGIQILGIGAASLQAATVVTNIRIDSGAQNMDLAQIELMRRSIT